MSFSKAPIFSSS